MIYENENEVGAAIKEQIDSGLVKREDLYIVSKVFIILLIISQYSDKFHSFIHSIS